jgi:hypothetical protein
MAKAIAGFFRTPQDGEAAQQALLSAGFTREEVSFLTGDTRGHETPAIGPIASTGSESEAVPDAWVGGVAGLAIGMVAAAIPGIGPLLAIGPLAGAIGGMTLGAAAGGLIGLLRDQGISQEEAEFYAEGVKRGGSLVTVQDVTDDRADKARDILKEHGAIDTETLAEEQRRVEKS